MRRPIRIDELNALLKARTLSGDELICLYQNLQYYTGEDCAKHFVEAVTKLKIYSSISEDIEKYEAVNEEALFWRNRLKNEMKMG